MPATIMTNNTTCNTTFLLKGILNSETREMVYDTMNEIVEVRAITMIPGMCETGTWSAIVEVYSLQDTLVAWEFITLLRKCESEGTPCSINYDEENHRGWLIKEFDFNFKKSGNLSPLRTEYHRVVKLEYDALDYDVLGYGDIEEVVQNEADCLERGEMCIR